jgi:hypothetical protein
MAFESLLTVKKHRFEKAEKELVQCRLSEKIALENWNYQKKAVQDFIVFIREEETRQFSKISGQTVQVKSIKLFKMEMSCFADDLKKKIQIEQEFEQKYQTACDATLNAQALYQKAYATLQKYETVAEEIRHNLKEAALYKEDQEIDDQVSLTYKAQ